MSLTRGKSDARKKYNAVNASDEKVFDEASNDSFTGRLFLEN